MVNINSLERDGLSQTELCSRNTMMMNTNTTKIPDRSQPGITMTAPTVRHWDVGDKYATGVQRSRKLEAGRTLQVSLEHSGALRDALEKLW